MLVTGKLLGKNMDPILGNYNVTDNTGYVIATASTYADGSYSAFANPGDWIVFSAPGYKDGGIVVESAYNEYNVQLDWLAGTKQISPVLIAGVAAAAYFIISKKKSKGLVGKVETEDIKNIALIVGGVMAFSVIKKILVAIGLFESKDSSDLDAEANDPNSFWNPGYWRRFGSYSYAINRTRADEVATNIYDAIGPFNDCEECVIGEIKSVVRTKANLSFIAYAFQEKYGQDLLMWLRGGVWPQDRLSDADVNIINTYVKALPNN